MFLSVSLVSSFVDCSSQCFGFIGKIFNRSDPDGGGGGRFYFYRGTNTLLAALIALSHATTLIYSISFPCHQLSYLKPSKGIWGRKHLEHKTSFELACDKIIFFPCLGGGCCVLLQIRISFCNRKSS